MEQIRPCGDCALCCKLIEIAGDGIDSGPGEWCRYARPGHAEGGCSIWAERPGQCRAFTCAWAGGILPEKMAPRKIRIMVASIDHPKIGKSWWLYEMEPGAIYGTGGKQLLYWLRSRQERLPFAICTGRAFRLYDRDGRLVAQRGAGLLDSAPKLDSAGPNPAPDARRASGSREALAPVVSSGHDPAHGEE